jgi:hypothetical protein
MNNDFGLPPSKRKRTKSGEPDEEPRMAYNVKDEFITIYLHKDAHDKIKTKWVGVGMVDDEWLFLREPIDGDRKFKLRHPEHTKPHFMIQVYEAFTFDPDKVVHGGIICEKRYNQTLKRWEYRLVDGIKRATTGQVIDIKSGGAK